MKRISIVCAALMLALPAVAAKPAASRARVVWMHSGKPVAGLPVVFSGPGVAVRKATTDAHGNVTLPGAQWIDARLADPKHPYDFDTLFRRGGSGGIRIAEPVRVTGKVASASAGSHLRVRVGFGHRLPVLARHVGERMTPPPSAEENHVYGVDMPPAAMRWVEAKVANGAFDSGWISADEAPQIVAFDDAGGVFMTDLPVPAAVAPGQTLDAGTLAIPKPRVLDVHAEMPNAPVPVALSVALNSARVDPGRRRELAYYLSLLDQVDDTLFEFAIGRGPYPLAEDGTARITGLPPFETVDATVVAPVPGIAAMRTLRVAAEGTTALRLAPAELGVPQALAQPLTISGTVTVADGRPVPKARVVYSDFPDKLETLSDEAGRFTFKDVTRAPRLPVFFVDAHDAELPAGFAVTKTFRFAGSDVTPAAPLRLVLPEGERKQARAAGSKAKKTLDWGVCTTFTMNDQYPACGGTFQVGSTWYVGDVRDCTAVEELEVLDVTVSQDTRHLWQFYYAWSPFVGALSGQNEFGGSYSVVTLKQPPDNLIRRGVIQLFLPSGALASGIPVYIPSIVSAPDPWDTITDSNGTLTMNCINQNPIHLWVNTPTYFLDQDVILDASSGYGSATLIRKQ